METSEILNWILGVLTMVAGGGWFVNWKAKATQEEAAGWKAMQEVYEKHFEDMQLITDNVREDRNNLLDDKKNLYNENQELRKKYIDTETQIMELKRDIARLGRRLEVVLPFTCGVAGCTLRKMVKMQDAEDNAEQ
jgi:phosphomannomutase